MGKQSDLSGRVVVITGAAGGIGAATAVRLARAGARLVLADLHGERLERQRAALSPDATVIALSVDVCRRASLDELASRALAAYGHVDVVVNCAGIVHPGGVGEMTEGAVRKQVEVNLLGAVFTTQAFLPLFLRQDGGHFIHIASLGALAPMPQEAVYCATKFAVRGFCLSLALELRSTPIRVSVVSPDSVRTPQLTIEALHGGSSLAFVSPPMDSATVAEAIVRTILQPRLEVLLPAARGSWVRLLNLSPRLEWLLYPLFDRIGRRGQRRYLEQVEALGRVG
jgi:NAD(P)-dependent dehydrogenase (short-subunit alcohol dehydrogenase family)